MKILPVTFQSKVIVIATLFFLLMLSPFLSHSLTIDELTTDFSQKKISETQAQISPADLQESFFNGDIQFLMQKLISLPEGQKKLPDVLALRAIGSIAGNQLEQGRRLLSEAEIKKAEETYILYGKAMLLRLSKDYTNAEKTIRKAIEIDQKHPYAWNILGRIQFDQRKYPEAISSFHQAITLNNNFLPAYLNLGAAYFQIKNYPQALEFFRAASDLNSFEDRAILGQTWTFEAMKDYPSAITSLKKSIDLKGESFDLLEYLAELQNKATDYKGLLTTGKLLSKTDSNKGLIWQARADIYLNTLEDARSKIDAIDVNSAEKYYLMSLLNIVDGKFEIAKQAATKALEKSPSYLAAQLADQTLNLLLDQQLGDISDTENEIYVPINYYFKGLHSIQKNNQQMALEYFNKAENFISGFSFSGISEQTLVKTIEKKEIRDIGLGTYYYFIKMPKRAQSSFQTILKFKSGSLLANYWLGQIAIEQGQREKAIEYYRKSISEIPFFPSLYTLAELSLMDRDINNAIQYYEKALELKSDPGILVKLGLLYEERGNTSAVEKFYTKLITDHDKLFIGYNQLAWFYTKNDIKLEKAMSLAKQANELQPGNASILDTMGWLFYKKGDLKSAEEKLSEANQILANNPSILYHLGAVNKAKGNVNTAKDYINKALSINPNFDEATAAREMLGKL